MRGGTTLIPAVTNCQGSPDGEVSERSDETSHYQTMMVVSRLGIRSACAELLRESNAEQIMSMSAIRPHRWTRAEVDRLVDARPGYTPRYELVDGELLVTPTPSHRHQRIILRLVELLWPYVAEHKLGEIFLGPAELPLVTGERYEPDLFLVPLLDGRRPPTPLGITTPVLIAETLSPGSSRHDRITKRHAFQRNRVAEYWIIDGDAQVFEVWHPDDERPAIVDERLVWSPAVAPVPFELDVPAFFASVADGSDV
jgi:Uma2 family endonuclease